MRLLLLALSTLAWATPPARVPNFDCADAAGNNYKIWLGTEGNLLTVTEKGRTREIPLSGANLGRPPHRSQGGPLVYCGWHESGQDMYSSLDLSNELVTEFTNSGGTSRVKVGLVVNHQERFGLKCTVSGYAAAVAYAESEGPAEKRYGALIAEASGARQRNGTLMPAGILAVEAAVRRFSSLPASKTKASRDLFIDALGPGLKNIDPRSLDKVATRLGPAFSELWKSILADTKYHLYPEVARCSAWIKEGARPGAERDLESIMAGFDVFVRSRGYKETDIRAFFTTEVLPLMKSLSETEAKEVRIALGPEGQSFMMQLWMKANGKRTASDYPEIERMTREIGSLVEAKELDPQAIQQKLEGFLKSSMGQNAEVRALFIQSASPRLKKLTPRQREDVYGWLEDPDERKLFGDLLR